MRQPINDWRMQGYTTLAESWTSPWTGRVSPKGTQITVVSMIKLNKDKLLTIALPNATALCLNISKRSWEEAKKIRSESGIDKSLESQISFESYSQAFDYIERVMESIVMAFTAIEAFVNEVIPDEFKYHAKLKNENNSVVRDKIEIERRLPIEEKLSKVLPAVLNISSPKGNQEWQSFMKLKKVRDRIVHMKAADRKSSNSDTITLWHELFRVEAPHKQAKETIDYFVTSMETKPLWHGEYIL